MSKEELPLVRPEEFVLMIQGKENFRGIPVMRTEWPTPEPTIDGWPLWSGLPQPEPVAYIDVETRNLSWAKPTRWETPTVVKMDKIPLYTKKEWVGLTEMEKAEIQMLKWWDWEDTFDLDGFTRAIEAKLKEKNV
jgi:hypothetical protein